MPESLFPTAVLFQSSSVNVDLPPRVRRRPGIYTSHTGGYGGGDPPLPIPNREVKPACADGTAMQCGRVGRRLLLKTRAQDESTGLFFCVYKSGNELNAQICASDSCVVFKPLNVLEAIRQALYYHFAVDNTFNYFLFYMI